MWLTGQLAVEILCGTGGRSHGKTTRADEANGIYHMLNRGNRREPLFHKTEDFEAFERMMVEAIERSRIKLYAYCLMPNHWHMVVSPEVDGEMGRFGQWLNPTHTPAPSCALSHRRRRSPVSGPIQVLPRPG